MFITYICSRSRRVAAILFSCAPHRIVVLGNIEGGRSITYVCLFELLIEVQEVLDL